MLRFSGLVLAFLALTQSAVLPTLGAQTIAYSLDGGRIEGRIVGCAESTIVIESSTGKISLPFGALDRIQIADSQETQPPASGEGMVVATLVDGSSVVCQEFVGRDDRWTARSVSGSSWEFPKGTVETLLMGTPSTVLMREWRNAVQEERSSDEMVIARPSDSIDRASGMIVAMTQETVEFSFDGQVLQAPRAKLLGLMWFRSRERRVEPAIQVRMRDGSRWEAVSLSMGESMKGLKWKTPCGVEGAANWSDIQELNFSSANVVWLASQSPISRKTFQRSLLKDTVAGRDEMLGPRFYSADGNLDAKSQDLNFAGPGEISFRIPQGFRRFVAKLRRSEKSRYASTVRCQVWVGDEVAWTETLTHDQLEASLDIPVIPEKRLRIVVECDSDLLLGTQLSWQQPRLIR